MRISLFFILLLISAFNARAAFIDGLEDVPVMEGLTQLPADSISFGNEESRLVEAILEGENSSFAQVKLFYQNTLPQMGWAVKSIRSNSLTFEREGEILDISAEEESPLRVRLTVKSKN